MWRALVASQTSTTLKTLTTGYKATSKVSRYQKVASESCRTFSRHTACYALNKECWNANVRRRIIMMSRWKASFAKACTSLYFQLCQCLL